MLQLAWQTVAGAASYTVSVQPFSYSYTWVTPYAALPDPAQWVLDNRKDTNNSGFGFDITSGPRVSLRLNGASQCDGGVTVRCPMMYRRVPALPIVTVDIDMSTAVAALTGATVTAGIVVYSARSNAPLLTCGLQVRYACRRVRLDLGYSITVPHPLSPSSCSPPARPPSYSASDPRARGPPAPASPLRTTVQPGAAASRPSS